MPLKLKMIEKIWKKIKRNRRRTHTKSSTDYERQNNSSEESGFEELDDDNQSSLDQCDTNSYGDNTQIKGLVDLNLNVDRHTVNDSQGMI